MLVALTPVLHLTVPAQPVALNVAVSALHKLFLLVVITGATGLLPVLITTSFDFGLTPQTVSHTTEYVPEAVTVIVLVVAFVLHFKLPLQLLAVNTALSFEHNVSFVAIILGVVGVDPVLMMMLFDALLVPQLFEHVTVYVPEVLTCIVLPAPPTFHVKLPLHPLAVKVAFSPSQHKVLFELSTGAVGVVPVVITIGLLAPLSPQLLLQVAV